MMNYTETASSRTIFSVVSAPCSPSQDPPVSTFSYVIGPIDPGQVFPVHAPLSTGDVCPLLVPAYLPRSILDDPAFHDGYEYNYLSEEEGEEEEDWTALVTLLVNHIYSSLTNTRLYRNRITGEVMADFLPWQVGWLLRDLTRVAETDRTLAYVGLAHLYFLLPLLLQDRPIMWPLDEPYRADVLHTCAVKAYRTRVQVYRKQGKSYDEAQRLALAGNV